MRSILAGVWQRKQSLVAQERVHCVMKCYSLLLGARNTPLAGKRFSSSDEERVRDITFRHFPEGFTVLNADGGWFDPAQRRFIEEDSRQVLVCADDRRQLRAWCNELARELKQKELLVVEMGTATTFRFDLRSTGESMQRTETTKRRASTAARRR